MPRTGRGGQRAGTPGKSYQNRTDLNDRSNVVPMMAAKGQQYGAAKAQMDAQRAIPVAAPPPPSTAGPVATSPATGPAPSVIPLDAPTARPGEPVTAGVPVGPGPGVEALGDLAGRSELRMRLGAMYKILPSREILDLIETLDSEPS